ncbi:MAG: asparagine synthase (glutamine-hydrolyzing) [Polyangiaceae bacterium]|nr:asparagine synthase (glutamine-hydrolyzing) [Polyangiaceae bacterium]
MCGIFGVWHPTGEPLVEADVVRSRDTLTRRGPDDAGLHLEPGLALAHRRLAIVDLSAAGRMPMANEAGDVWCVFNGEIYEFQRLRAELAERGHVFRSRTDSEVIIHAYEEWGDECFARLDGMFAVALWDRPRRRVVLARDAAGEKPLYFAHEPGRRLVFGSTLAPLLAWPSLELEVDPAAVREYASLGYVGAPRSILRGVRKLRPGTALVIEASGTERERVHFDLGPTARARREPARFEDAVARLDVALGEAVETCRVADVPLGAFLSGGVDSSLVVALMARRDPRSVRTFTVGFADRELDESGHAHAIARHLGVENTMMVVSPRDVLDEVPALAEAFDEPMADYSALPTLAVSRLARRHVTVALTGDGGDEAFAGYRYYAGAALFERWAEGLPASARRLASHASRFVPTARARRALARAGTPDTAALLAASGFYRGPTAARGLELVLPGAAAGAAEAVAVAIREAVASGVPSATEAGLLWDATNTLPGAWLCKVDRASMFVSLETRAPMLRRRVLELAFRLPLEHRVRGLSKKRVLRALLARYLPRALFERPKQGFTPPMGRWLREDLAGEVRDRLATSVISRRGLFEPRGVATAIEEHARGTADHAQLLWALLHLEQWYERWMRRG